MENYYQSFIFILYDMSPYLLLGFLIAGILHVYMPSVLYKKYFYKNSTRSVVNAALLGVPLPLCSCGVIPTALSLKKDGASDGATVSFLVSTPQTGADSILATYSILGLGFAIFRSIAAFLLGIIGGVFVDKCEAKNIEKETKIDSKLKSCCCHSSHEHKSDECNDTNKKKGIIDVLHYAFIHMIDSYGKWLMIGLLVAAAITTFVPDSAFVLFKEYYILNILLILLISVPMYICATGSIPIALSLIMKGISPGAAFVFLMAGPATNFASLIILKKELGTRKTAIYLFTIVVGAILCAIFIDFVLPSAWFLTPRVVSDGSDCCAGAPLESSWLQIGSSIVFALLYIYTLIAKQFKQKESCCCG